MTTISEDEAYQLFLEAYERNGAGTITGYAKYLGVRPAFVWNILKRNTPITGVVLDDLDLECIKVRRYKNKERKRVAPLE